MNAVRPLDPQLPTSSVVSGRLDPLDITKCENFFLKIENLKLQGEKLHADYIRCGQMLKEQQELLRAFREALNKKYGVDLTACKIEADGTFVLSAREG